MRKLILFGSVCSLAFASCQNPQVQNNDQKLAEQAIAIHDEIMPQMPHLDKIELKLDTILNDLTGYKVANPALDTAKTRVELSALRDSVTAATNNMNDWMMNFEPENENEDYQKKQVEHVTAMKAQFERVHEQIKNSQLENYKK